MQKFENNYEINKIYTSFNDYNNWISYKDTEGLVWFKGYIHNLSKRSLFKKALKLNKSDVASFLNSLDGHFCLMIIKKNFSFVAVDKVRSFPIIYTIKKNELILSENGNGILKKIKLQNKDIDFFSSELFALSGYSFGENTIYKDVKQINPGNYLVISGKKLSKHIYYTWMPWKTKKNSNNFKTLQTLNENIIKKLIKSCKGKQIIVPLSGGLDSRFIVAGLKNFGFSNVLCVSYGIVGNKDAIIAKQVCEKLGYKWLYVKYTSKKFRKIFNSNDYKRYLEYCDSFTSIHFVGEYIMLKELKKSNQVDKNAVIVNGQSGDFITGNHIPKNLLQKKSTITKRLSFLATEHTKAHYKHWKSLISKKTFKSLHYYFENVIKQLGGLPLNPENDYAVLEFFEFINRQSKYVINGQRNYEYFGYEWRLPLWDDEYLKFWGQVSYKEKLNQNLYVNVLKKSNWGNVWNSIAINPIVIAPKWIIPIRVIAKIIFFIFGKKKWHRFEKKYLDYFMTTTCCYGPWSYMKVITDKRGHKSPIGWLIEHYLKNKGLNWKGLLD